MNEVKLTVSQVAAQIGETVHIVRNWVSDFRSYIPLEKSEAGYNLFNQDAINVIKKIQTMSRDQKLTTRQISAILSGAEKPVVSDKNLPPAVINEINEIKGMLAEQMDLNRQMIMRLDEHIKKRDEQLMFVLRELRDQKKLLEVKQEPGFRRLLRSLRIGKRPG